MIRNKLKLIIAAFALMAAMCTQPNSEPVSIKVEGMTCEGCENAVTMNVKELEGIKDIKASHADEVVTVSFDSNLVTLEEIKSKITETGYTVADK
jgi:copper chaperone CopZ